MKQLEEVSAQPADRGKCSAPLGIESAHVDLSEGRALPARPDHAYAMGVVLEHELRLGAVEA